MAAGKHLSVHRARGIVCLVVFLSVGIGLAVHTGWGTLSSMGYDAVAYICPLGALETLIAGHSMVSRAIVGLAIAVIAVALAGRFFCAWVCPVPPIQRFFHPKDTLARAAQDEQDQTAIDVRAALPAVGGQRDGLHLDSRHAVLAGALLSTAVFGFPVFCLICPVGLTFATFIAVWRAFVEQDPSWSLLVFPAILVLELVVFRRWCHTLCPLGALMSLLSVKAVIAHPQVDESACLRQEGVDCHACVETCPEKLDPHSYSIPECTKCGACVEGCPAHALSLKLLKLK